MSDVLNRLAETLAARKSADPKSSYVAKLYAQGLDAIQNAVSTARAPTV